MRILGIRIDNLDIKEALNKVLFFLNSNTKSLIFTPNPEMLVKASKDKIFADILNTGDLNICDGFGLQLIAFLRGKKISRVTGVDLMLAICELCESEYKSIYLLGTGSKDVIEKTVAELRNKIPGVKIAGFHPGLSILDNSEGVLEYDKNKNEEIIDLINGVRPDVLFVAFGMGKQEKWLVQNINKLTKVKIGMGVGGAFDYISGYVPRAPLLMRNFGLEWAYRFYKQPERLKRIFNATIKFLFLAFSDKKYDQN